MSHKCLGEDCNNNITYRFALCRVCETRYGHRVATWPAWLRFLWNDIQRQRRREKRHYQREVPLIYYD